MDVMQPFYDICADPKAYARSWKARTGGKVIGTLCSYAPEELILAAGALGFRLVGGSGAISKADAHLQAYSCSLVRGALEDALSHRLDFLDGTIFPHTCDSIQGLATVVVELGGWEKSAFRFFHGSGNHRHHRYHRYHHRGTHHFSSNFDLLVLSLRSLIFLQPN